AASGAGAGTVAARLSCGSRPARASAPKPLPLCMSMRRREMGPWCAKSVDIDRLIRAEECVQKGDPCCRARWRRLSRRLGHTGLIVLTEADRVLQFPRGGGAEVQPTGRRVEQRLEIISSDLFVQGPRSIVQPGIVH